MDFSRVEDGFSHGPQGGSAAGTDHVARAPKRSSRTATLTEIPIKIKLPSYGAEFLQRACQQLIACLPAMIDASSIDTAWPPRRVALATLVVVAVLAAFLLLYFFGGVLFLLFIGVVVAITLSPVVALLERAGLSRPTASVAVYLTLGGLLLAGAWFALAGGLLADRSTRRTLASHLPSVSRISQASAQRDLFLALPNACRHGCPAAPNPTVLTRPSARLPSSSPTASFSRKAFTRCWRSSCWHSTGRCTKSARSAPYCCWRRRHARRDAPVHRADRRQIGTYLRAKGLLCLIMGGLVLVAYSLIGVPYALSLAIVAGILEALPVFGPALAAARPCWLPSRSARRRRCGRWPVVVLQQFESNVLVPRLMDRSVGVNAIVTLLAIAALAALWGLAGAVLAIPMAAIAQLVLDRWVFRPDPVDLPPAVGRDAVSLLRYQLRELLQDVQVEFRRKSKPVTQGSDRLEDAVETLARDLDRALFAVAPQATTVSAPSVEVQ